MTLNVIKYLVVPLSSSIRNQQGPEEALLKKTFAARKKNVLVFQSIIQENKRQLII